MKEITSVHNPQVQRLRELQKAKYRRESGLFLAESVKMVREAIALNLCRTLYVDGRRQQEKVTAYAVEAGYDTVQPVHMLYGRMIDQRDVEAKRRSIVIEQETARTYFGTDHAVGRTLLLLDDTDREEFTVVGVYQKPDSLLMAMVGGETTVYVPSSVYFTPDSYGWELNCYVAEDINTDLLFAQMTGYLARMTNRTEDEIICVTARHELSSVDTVMSGLSLAVGAIAAISLLVGGIGIMNIMLVSVTERTREIGIRKALGARTGHILTQFLIESALISAAGGVIGTLLGVGIVALGGLLIGIDVVVNPLIVVIAVGFSAMVGIFFGIYPARQAAAADPIDALRYE